MDKHYFLQFRLK